MELAIPLLSHLLQMRGLKRTGERFEDVSRQVASFTDAWIETKHVYLDELSEESHLLQMRGLKLLMLQKMKKLEVVASFTDAWIETFDDRRGTAAF